MLYHIVQDTTEKGRLAKEISTRLLVKKGCTILRRNFRHRRVEIDIIAHKNDTLVFIEVKGCFRSNPILKPMPSLSQRRQILLGANAFLQTTTINPDNTRFDLIVVSGISHRPLIDHLKGAFDPSSLIM